MSVKPSEWPRFGGSSIHNCPQLCYAVFTQVLSCAFSNFGGRSRSSQKPPALQCFARCSCDSTVPKDIHSSVTANVWQKTFARLITSVVIFFIRILWWGFLVESKKRAFFYLLQRKQLELIHITIKELGICSSLNLWSPVSLVLPALNTPSLPLKFIETEET